MSLRLAGASLFLLSCCHCYFFHVRADSLSEKYQCASQIKPKTQSCFVPYNNMALLSLLKKNI